MKRTQHLHALRWTFPTAAATEALLESVIENPSRFSKISSLEIQVWPYVPQNIWSKESGRLVAGGAALSHMLLSQARSLTFLRLCVSCLMWIPTNLHTLQHLQIVNTTEGLAKMLPAIQKLQALRTLSLERVWSEVKDFPINVSLNSLSQLESVQLHGVTPALLTLAKGTALHVVSKSLVAAQSEVWSSAAKALRSFRILVTEESISAEELPKALCVPNGLESIVIQCACFGTQQQPILLDGSWLQLERFCLRCDSDAFVVIGDGVVNWQKFGIFCNDDLSMQIPNIFTFAASCTDFFFKCRTFVSQDPLRLAQYLRGHGVDVQEYMDELWRCHNENQWRQHLYTPDLLCQCRACSICRQPETSL